MQSHQIKPKTKYKIKRRIGRGGKRGTYSGRGLKGQKSRSGRKMRPEMRDVIKRLPKRRGYRFHSIQIKPSVINVGLISEKFVANDKVTPALLAEKGLIHTASGILPKVKILGSGKVDKKITVSGCIVSKSAKEKIEKAGGKVE